jgi:predicted outer membrane lipoprotein
LVWWILGILLATMYFVIIHWLFRGKVTRHADGYGH